MQELDHKILSQNRTLTCLLSMSLFAFSESIVSVLFPFPFLRAWVLVISSVCKIFCIFSISYQRFSEIVGWGNNHVADAILDIAQKLMFFLKSKNKKYVHNTNISFIIALATQINLTTFSKCVLSYFLPLTTLVHIFIWFQSFNSTTMKISSFHDVTCSELSFTVQ